MTETLLSDFFIEILGAATGLIYLYLSIKQNIWLWPWGIVTSLLYVFVFFQAKFYAGMSLQFYYLAVSIYGWNYWLKGSAKEGSGNVPVIRITWNELLIFLFIIFFLTVISGFALDTYTDSPLPYWDAFTTAGSIVATWMLARKYLEHWIFWIVIDTFSIGIYIFKGLYPTVILFAVYTGLAVIGFIQWKKEWKKSNAI